MLTSIEIDGDWYHAEQLEDGTVKVILSDYYNKPIPLTACLCYARMPSECCCACSSWDNYSYDEDDY